MREHRSVDGVLIEVGMHFWDNNLDVVVIEAVAEHSNPYADTGCTQTWHRTNRGSYDTLDGDLQRIGRLARFYEGLDAANFPPGTSFVKAKTTKFVKVKVELTLLIEHELVDEGPNEVIDESYDELSAKIRVFTSAIEGVFAQNGWAEPNIDVDIDP